MPSLNSSRPQDEYTQILGLSSGQEGGPGRIASFEQLERLKELTKEMIRQEIDLAHANEMASLYLPSLFRTYFNNTLDVSSEVNCHIWSLYSQIIYETIICCSAMTARFVRHNEVEARSFYLVLAEKIAIVSRSAVERLDPERYILLASLVVLFQTFFAPIIMQKSTSFTSLPIPSPPIRAQLFTSIAQVGSRPSTALPGWIRLLPLDRILETTRLMSSASPVDLELSRAGMMRGYPSVAWWKCALRWLPTDREPTEDERRFEHLPHEEEGEEMKVCGRCFAVRYCCEEHQRLDWKRHHKKLCFTPSW